MLMVDPLRVSALVLLSRLLLRDNPFETHGVVNSVAAGGSVGLATELLAVAIVCIAAVTCCCTMAEIDAISWL